MKKLATSPHCLPSRACKSNVLEVLRINDVCSSNDSDSFEEEDVGETTSSHQEIDVQKVVENGLAAIMPRPLEPKTIDAF